MLSVRNVVLVSYAGLILLICLPVLLVNAAPGDLKIEIIAAVGDEFQTPDSIVIADFDYFVPLDSAPIAIDEFGTISFAASVDAEDDEYGFFQAVGPGQIFPILQSNQTAPGITANDPNQPGGFRTLNFSPSPKRGYAMSRNGFHHALTMWTEFDGEFLYTAEAGDLENSPRTWPARLSETHNLWEAIEISDGRGTTKTRSGGTGADMVVTDNGILYWDAGAGAILRSLVPGEISAIMFTDTPAPGYDESENAMLDAPYRFRGIDNAGNAIFHCRVTKTSGTSNAVFHHNFLDNSLTLLWDSAATSLPGGVGLEGVTADVDAESVFVTQDGAVYLRGRVSSTQGGFWRVTLDLDGTLTTEPLGYFYSNGFSPVLVDGLEELSFRNIHLADWAVSENGTVFFSADLAGSSGTSTTSAQEGIWKIDPEDLSITTVARFGQNADEGGTNATYAVFSDLTAAGDDKLAFIAELSDGNRGLFGTDKNGGVIRIALEGSPLVDCEDSEESTLACETVASIVFTPDHAGEDLIYSKGTPGLNSFGEMAFVVGFENMRKALVRAKFEGDERPTGTTFIWDGGAGTNDWHTVNEGVSNWTDAAGVRWDKAPGTAGNEKVFVTTGATVELRSNVSVREITVGASDLTVFADIEFTHFLKGEAGSELKLESGKISSSGGDLMTFGTITKSGSGAFTLEVDDFDAEDAQVTIRAGQLNFKNTISAFKDTPVVANGGTILFDENLTQFRGDSATLTAEGGTIDIQSLGPVFDTDTAFTSNGANSLIRLGRSTNDIPAEIQLRLGQSSEGTRALTFFGDGNLEIKQPIQFASGDSLVNVHNGGFGTALKIDLVPGKAIEVPDGVLFINRGNMILENGELKGASAAGEILNSGSIRVPEGATFDRLDCVNEGTIEVSGTLKLGMAEFKPWSRLKLDNGTLEVLDGDFVDVSFKKNSQVIAQEGNSELVLSQKSGELAETRTVDFEATLDMKDGSSLELVNTFMGEDLEVSIGEGAELVIDNLIFSKVTFKGEGTCLFKGAIVPIVDESEFRLRAKFWELEDVQMGAGLDKERKAEFSMEGRSVEEFDDDDEPRTVGEGSGLVKALTLFPGSNIQFNSRADVVVEGPIEVSKSVISVFKRTVFNSGVEDIGDLDSVLEVAGIDGHLVFPPDVALFLEIDFKVFDLFNEIEVGENSVVDVFGVLLVLDAGKLSAGVWNIGDFASLQFDFPTYYSDIEEISPDARVELGKPHPELNSFQNLPNPIEDLTVLGTLELRDGAVLNMTGKTVFNKGNVKIKEPAPGEDPGKIIGDVESIRDQVQGVPALAGNINIEGSLTTDGVIALGASPGSGLITGDLTLLPGSEMRVEFAGAEPGTRFDFLEVGGTANLDGQLTLSLIDEYVPDNGTEFLFLKAGTVAGSFAEIEQDTLGRERRFAVTSGAEGLTATLEALSISTYADWRAAFFSPTEAADDLISGVTADPDDDGIVNLAEYLSGGLPEFPSLAPLFQVSTEPDQFGLQLANGVDDYAWQLEYSPNLIDWESVATNVLEEDVGDVITILGIELQEATPGGDRFYRLGIEAAAP